jgi:hypothetical protein
LCCVVAPALHALALCQSKASLADTANAAVAGAAAAAGGGRGFSLCRGDVGAAGDTANERTNRAGDVIGPSSDIDADAATMACEP